MQYRQPIQECLSTRTIPSARLKDAPVGQTSTQGGSAQCWHIIGNDLLYPVAGSRISTFLIHCASVAGLSCPCSPFSVAQAVTHSLQPVSQRLVSINIPQRTSLETASSRVRAAAGFAAPTPYRMTPGASATPAAAAAAVRKLRRDGSNSSAGAGLCIFTFITPGPPLRFPVQGVMHDIGSSRFSRQRNRDRSGKNVRGWPRLPVLSPDLAPRGSSRIP